MKGSMRWKPGPLVEVSNAPPLRRNGRERERGNSERLPGSRLPPRGGPVSPVVDTDVPLIDLVHGREERGGRHAEGESGDGAELGHARHRRRPRRATVVITARPQRRRQGALQERGCGAGGRGFETTLEGFGGARPPEPR